ncbi:MAG: MotA/TolQ/ExbB proton channel family protein [Enterobacteriaceae bacterium]
MMNTEFGINAIWQQGDPVTYLVASILLLMSIVSWIIIISKLIRLYQLKRKAKLAEAFWHERDFTSALNYLGDAKKSPWYRLATEGNEAVQHHKNSQQQLHDELDLSDWVTRTLRNKLDIIAEEMTAGLPILASIGATAPFVGLFGTVWGIYHAMMGLSAGGMASIDKVAGPIGEALIMTAFGLAVAIPAVLGYNALVRSNKIIDHKLRCFAHDLHALFMTGARVHAA